MEKTAIITGGATGIGKATSKILCEDGYFVVILCNKSVNEAESLCNSLNMNKRRSMYLKADLRNYKEVDSAFETVLSLFGRIDLLVNNAGIAQQKLFCDITNDDWHNMMSSNLDSVFYTCKKAVPFMIKRHSGNIINISSMWGICGASCEVHYSASKAAVIGFTKALAQELGPSGINVNCIAPGVINTQMNSNLSADDIEVLKDETPLGSVGSPEDIANCVSFLASEKSNFITGQVISPNGGFLV